MNKETQSKIMHNYNVLKAYYDRPRLDRALGIAMSKHGAERMETEYHTTEFDCCCKDYEFRHAHRRKDQNGNQYSGPCKHQLAVLILKY